MKKLFFSFAVVALLGASSCSKCGHCHYETSYPSFTGTGITTDKADGDIVCSGEENTVGPKASELNCKAWPAQKKADNPNNTTTTWTSSWQSDK